MILAKSDYIYSANRVYINLNDTDFDYACRVKVISYVKTCLLLNEELESFNIDGVLVDVDEYDGGYYLCFNNDILDIKVENKIIVDYEYR